MKGYEPIIAESGKVIGWSATPRCPVCNVPAGDTHTPECVKQRYAPQDAPECEGHPAGPFDPQGVTVYCDGTCR